MSVRTLCLLVLAIATILALEDEGGVITRVTDGDTVTVQRRDGTSITIRLLSIDTPESRDNSHGAATESGKRASASMRELAPVGTAVRLWTSRTSFEMDRYHRVLAVVLIGPNGTESLNAHQIRRGWSPYWRKYGDLSADATMHAIFLKAHEEAEASRSGAWSLDPEYMRNKTNERTAPKP